MGRWFDSSPRCTFKEADMCFTGNCKYERPSGNCGKPRDRQCPDGMSEEELEDEQDRYEAYQEMRFEEWRERQFGI